MARIAGVDLPKQKRIEIALTYIYGLGLSSSQKILEKANVHTSTRCKDLTDEQVGTIRQIIDESYLVEGPAKRIETMSIKRLMEINCIRGQRTRTNARTRRGSKKTVAGKKK